ncbi:hypothetical protein NO559_10495 [Dasania sp. GY-MA-18]|uniref:Uncharacterized protein n=1 Tax=Dasania phycosphaerae TaxID=2950436 RepID=A0A9J6RMD8_9GAMM|nr:MULTISPECIES: hypothetical protein [Dasania]MCR8923204.1 hypothetical protein [Dasania sp. GY-MA-18]MCZ0865636.1 hypothetical protein [Dasania phycosphaerae]MCZ0869361.1 hypothetical protein [Dasania phycosphaerae]
MAKTYNEQLYCEIEASSEGKSLPKFNDFQKNTPLIQSLLLKPHARKLGITIKMATKTTKQRVATSPATAAVSDAGLSHCDFKAEVVSCGDMHYRFMGNKANASLGVAVLDASNTMQLPVYDNTEVDAYLAKAYGHYLNKMIEIGLAGVTLTYGNFDYIFHDLRAQAIDFNQRFETMYRYLKKDKRTMGIKQSTAPSDMTAKDCFLLDELLVCSRGHYNYIYKVLSGGG